MSWKDPFLKGVSFYQASRLDESLDLFDEAIERGGDQQYIVYDSRAAVYEKLGRPKDALRDAKKVIDLAPHQWQGYARSARLFLKARKFDASLTMVDLSMDRLKPRDAKRRVELSTLKGEVHTARREAEEHQRRVQYHFGKLPVEIFGEIFQLVIDVHSAKLLVLLHICTHWRSIIWNNPALWDTLSLTIKNPSGKAKLWIERSRGRIRDFQMGAEVKHHPKWSHQSLHGLLWDHVQKCRVQDWDIVKYLGLISMTHVLSTFRELEIVDVYAPLKRDGLFREGASLQRLTLNGVLFSWNTLSLTLKNLLSLVVLNDSFSDDVFPTLEANPLLEKLVLDFRNGIAQFQNHPTSPLSLPRLVHLEVAGLTWAPNLVKNLSLPALRVLRLSRGNISLDDILLHVLQTGLPHLTELSITSCSVASSTLIQFLGSTPSLEVLQLNHLYNTANAVIDALASPLSSPTPQIAPGESLPSSRRLRCPSLTHLDVSNSPDIKTGPLVRLVKSRLPSTNTLEEPIPDGTEHPSSPPVAMIRCLIADTCPQLDADWIPWLRKNVAEVSCVYMTKKAAKQKR